MSEISQDISDAFDDEKEIDHDDLNNGMRDALDAAFTTDESETEDFVAELPPMEDVAADDVNDEPPADAAPSGETAPASWSPTARESWASIPEDVRSEISKRELQVQNSFNETTQARQLSTQFQQLTQPYESVFRAQGTDTLTGINNALQMTAQLQMGTPEQKAQVATDIIKHFGIDIRALDDKLAGVATPAQEVSPQVAEMQQQLNNMNNYIQQQQYGQQQQVQQKQHVVNQETQKFIAETPFGNDLRMVMADFMDIAAKQGTSIDLKTAYDRALATRPDIQQILQQRNSSTQGANALQQANRAASSVPQSHVGGGVKQAPDSMRGALEDAWNS
tara:strand:+ start:329 stop:1333 length:1005 start_codon:yes stop_codon:yes gene_type:complete